MMEPLKTGLAGLKQIGNQLRLPLHHTWDFGVSATCDSIGCAILTTHIAWPEQVRVPCLQSVADALGFSRSELCPLFGMTGMETIYGNKTYAQITPIDVADAIDAYIAKHQPLPTLAIIITAPQTARAAL